jgi:integrase
MKLRLKSVIAKPNNTSIIIYYSKDGKEMRFPTGISIPNEKKENGKYKHWNYKTNMVTPGITDYETSKQKIESLVHRGNDILIDLYKKNVVPSVEVLEKMMSYQDNDIISDTNSYILDLYNEFHKMKSDQFHANGTPISLKDFTSTKNLIIDFETYKQVRYQIFQFDNNWFREMLNFMRVPHEDEELTNRFYTTDGNMGNKTCKKRFDIFVQFSEFLKERKVCTQESIDELKRFRKKNIKVPKTDKVTLDIDEIYTLYNYHFDDKKYREVVDTFVFICVTGLRYRDYLIFDHRLIKKSKNSDILIYERKARKTKGSSGLNYKFPLCDLTLEILKKYNNKLPHPTKPNEDIKDALKFTELFNEPTTIIDKNTETEKLKYECISMHKGRDSFITNLVDHTPLNTLMKYTGHSKLSTLQGYIDPNREIDTSLLQVFNRKI